MTKAQYYTNQRNKTLAELKQAEANKDYPRVYELYYRLGMIDAYRVNDIVKTRGA